MLQLVRSKILLSRSVFCRMEIGVCPCASSWFTSTFSPCITIKALMHCACEEASRSEFPTEIPVMGFLMAAFPRFQIYLWSESTTIPICSSAAWMALVRSLPAKITLLPT